MKRTNFLSLPIVGETREDLDMTFSKYREMLSGDINGSAMNAIDRFAKSVNDNLNTLNANAGGKTELVYDQSAGAIIRSSDNRKINFRQLIEYLVDSNEFTYLLFGDRAYLPSLINDDESGMHYVYFESTMVDGGMSKNAVISVTSGDGLNISGISTANVANENYNNKVAVINDRNKTSTDSYTSVKAVVDFVTPAMENAGRVKTVNGVQPNASGDVLLTNDMLPAEAVDVEARNDISSIKEKVIEKNNLFVIDNQTINGITILNNKDESITINGTATSDTVIPIATLDDGTYTALLVYISGNADNNSALSLKYGSDTMWVSPVNTRKTTDVTFGTNISLQIAKDYKFTDYNIHLFIIHGESVDTEYGWQFSAVDREARRGVSDTNILLDSISSDIYNKIGDTNALNVGDTDNLVDAVNLSFKMCNDEDKNLRNEIKSQRSRIENLEAAAEGYLYREDVDDETAYQKTVPEGVMPWASLDKVGGKTLVWNQLWRNEYDPFTRFGLTISKAERGVTITGVYDGTASYDQASFGKYNLKFKRDGRKYFVFSDKETPVPFCISGYGTQTNHYMFFSATADTDWDGYVALKLYGFSGKRIDIVDTRFFVVDLRMCGAEDITSFDDPRIAVIEAYAKDHPEHNIGALVSYSPDKVVSRGRNLFPLRVFQPVTQNGLTASSDGHAMTIKGTTNGSRTFFYLHDNDNRQVLEPGTYSCFVHFEGSAPNKAVCLIGAYKGSVYYKNLHRFSVDGSGNPASLTFTVDDKCDISSYVDFDTSVPSGSFVDCKVYCTIVKGSEKPTTVIPYRTPITYTYADLIQKYFPDGMHSAGEVYDSFEVDDDGKVWAVKRVGTSMFDGSESWTKQSNGVYVVTDKLSNIAGASVSDFAKTINSYGLNSVVTWVDAENAIYMNNKTVVNVTMTGKTDDVMTWETTLNNNHLVINYVLATTIRTEVTEPFPSDLNVEAGGTITLANQHGDDYRVPLPNQETFMIKLGGAAE